MRFFTGIIVFAGFASSSLLAQILITEVMFDPAGTDYTQEFVEIYNAGNEILDLSGWSVGDGEGTDSILDSGSGLDLEPGRFGLILDGDYSLGERVYDSLIPDSALVLTIDGTTLGSGGLSNSTSETVSIFNLKGVVMDSYTYSIGNETGHSDERVGGSPVWKDSQDLYGTPGAPNSVSPKTWDVSVKFVQPANPVLKPGELLELEILVFNLGKQRCQNLQIELCESGELQDSPVERAAYQIPELASGDSVVIQGQWWPPASGAYRLYASLPFSMDQKPENNIDSLDVQVRYIKGALVINEMMVAPVSGQGEWIELYNPGTDTVCLTDWSFSDNSQDEGIVFGKDKMIPPDGYFILYQNEMEFSEIEYADYVKRWPNLNNGEDTITLFDPTGFQIDVVCYEQSSSVPGYSMERLNPLGLSSASENWRTSVAVAGSTPGQQNSVYCQIIPDQVLLSIEPNPFTPDDDGFEDRAVISYQLPNQQARLNLFVFDTAGRLVRHLRNGQETGMVGQVVWDGCNDSGTAVNMGLYVVYLEVLDDRQGVVQSAKQCLALARTQ